MGDYLHECLALHRAVSEIRFERAQPLDRVEQHVRAALDRSAGKLTYEVLQTILNRDVWKPDMFGFWPPIEDLKAEFGAGWELRRLPKQEAKVIPKLLTVFRQIEPVSVVLRFARPRDYGIVSAPVEKILGIGPGRRQDDRYRQYVCSLRELRDRRGFKTAAEVDMALWTLQVGVLDSGLLKRHADYDGQARAIEQGFGADIGLRQLRARNLIKPLFDELSKLQLAEALLPTDLGIAGQIAGIEFEYWVRRWLDQDRVRRWPDQGGEWEGLYTIIRASRDRCGGMHDRLQDAREIRNDAVHDPDRLTPCRVQRLIKTARSARASYHAQWLSHGR